MGTKTNGLLALLGLGAVAWWKYKNSSPEEKQMVKDKVNTAKDNFNQWGNDIKSKASDLTSQVKDKVSETTSTNATSPETGMNQGV
ncbi:YtxH domain-containing protein [Kaistella daneshvariae]|jgi:gas vesicle protein|uniref:YtxH domain-containing protein n=1 Tax=Kaistella daneshvariae TaxID=2487074 RepID=A0A3N0WRM0_9FLAO|nr:YtxH domain-containing protein [Kaistella daneshvariae]AZI66853.1 YtxH domain-containing protein [Kaistella daneshvariae]ROI07746.1 YtxH domain-containing protein [Kaistella daneshvariae]